MQTQIQSFPIVEMRQDALTKETKRGCDVSLLYADTLCEYKDERFLMAGPFKLFSYPGGAADSETFFDMFCGKNILDLLKFIGEIYNRLRGGQVSSRDVREIALSTGVPPEFADLDTFTALVDGLQAVSFNDPELRPSPEISIDEVERIGRVIDVMLERDPVAIPNLRELPLQPSTIAGVASVLGDLDDADPALVRVMRELTSRDMRPIAGLSAEDAVLRTAVDIIGAMDLTAAPPQ